MANTISNNKISHLVSSQLPFFVRNDHENFVRFMEAYYEYLEQDTKVVNRIKNVQSFQDVDRTIDEFSDKLYENFLKFIPEDAFVDKRLLLKNIKDFYRARGTEKAARFLMRIIFDEEIEFYYPKKDVLRVSDGKWFKQQSLRISGTEIDGVADSSLTGLERFIATTITGSISGSTAIVERVDRFYEQGTLVDELIISNVNGDFENGESVSTTYNDEFGVEHDIESVTFGGIINSVTIDNEGTGYSIGDPVVIVSNTGTGACVTVSQISTGNLASITVVDGGAGYQNGNFLLITGGGGSGANANVSSVTTDERVHPNTYNISNSTIIVEANTQIGNSVYTNLKSSNALSWIANGLHFWRYANTGPARTILVISAGSEYTSAPTMSIIANNAIQSLGILGKMEIVNAGQNYTRGDTIEITNVYGGYGGGALGNVYNVNSAASNAISEIRFKEMTGHIIGGSGYDINFLPVANVVSSTGNGANIIVTSLLGSGVEMIAANSTLGAIQRVVITNRGSSYEDAYADATGSGDGNANLSVSVLQGVYEYPGRFLNDDGFISSYNFIQDRDYYQNFSYVIKTRQSIDKYRQVMKELNHPAGTKMFGEYMTVNETYDGIEEDRFATRDTITKQKSTLLAFINTSNGFVNPVVWIPGHTLVPGDTITLEFISGNVLNAAMATSTYTPNGIYTIGNAIVDFVEVNSGKYLQGSMNIRNTSGETVLTGVHISPDGKRMYTLGFSRGRVYEYTLGRPWDVTTARLAGSHGKYSPAIIETQPRSLVFSANGDYFYTMGVRNTITQYIMTESWNAQTAIFHTSSLNVASSNTLGAVYGFSFSANGDYLYIGAGGTGKTLQLRCTENWNVNTAVSVTEKTLAVGISGMTFNESGNLMIILVGSGVVYTFGLANNWNINSAVEITSSRSSSLFSLYATGGQDLKFRPDGLMFYSTDYNNDQVIQVPLTQAWNCNTMLIATSSVIYEGVLAGTTVT